MALMSDTVCQMPNNEKFQPLDDEKDEEKKEVRKTVRMEEPLYILARARMKDVGVKGFSSYVRGLIISDALAAKTSITGIDVPGWLVGKKINITIIDPEAKDQKQDAEPSKKGGKAS